MPVTAGASCPEPARDGMTMDGMTPAHAKTARRDHSWVLAVIAACCLIKVWPSWVGIGAEAGFPKIARMATDWTLAVVIEAYWAYAVYAWLAAVGRRSRRFAMWSAAGVFILSVVGQSAAPVMAATAVKVFANALPVIVLALIAILVHLRHLDRAEAEAAEQAQREAEREAHAAAAETDERTALRAELETAQAALETAQRAAQEAAQRAERAEAKAERAERKLAGQKPNRTRTKDPNAGRRTAPNAPPNGKPNAAPETEVPEDIDAHTKALGIWLANPKITGKDLGAAVGLGERWGQLRKTEFANSGAGPEGVK